MKKVILIFITLSLYMCKTTQDCSSNQSTIDKFKRYLNLIKSAQEPGVETSIDDYRSALFFLTNVTGIMTKADYSSTVGYRDMKEYADDIKKWKGWLAKNKCNLTPQYVDSCLKGAVIK